MFVRGSENSWGLYGINLDDDRYVQAVAGTIFGRSGLIFGQNLGLTREWFAIQDRQLHHRVSRKIFLKDEALLRKFYICQKWAKIILL